MSEQEDKWQRIYDLINAENKTKFFRLPHTKQRKQFYREKKSLFKEKGESWIEQKMKTRSF